MCFWGIAFTELALDRQTDTLIAMLRAALLGRANNRRVFRVHGDSFGWVDVRVETLYSRCWRRSVGHAVGQSGWPLVGRDLQAEAADAADVTSRDAANSKTTDAAVNGAERLHKFCRQWRRGWPGVARSRRGERERESERARRHDIHADWAASTRPRPTSIVHHSGVPKLEIRVSGASNCPLNRVIQNCGGSNMSVTVLLLRLL